MGSKKTKIKSACAAIATIAAFTSKGYAISPSTRPGVSQKSIIWKWRADDVLTWVVRFSTSDFPNSFESGAKCGYSNKVESPLIGATVFFDPHVIKVNPCVSIATPVRWMSSPTYQLIKEDFPALWLPMIITLTFLRGAKISFRPTSFPIAVKPLGPLYKSATRCISSSSDDIVLNYVAKGTSCVGSNRTKWTVNIGHGLAEKRINVANQHFTFPKRRGLQ